MLEVSPYYHMELFVLFLKVDHFQFWILCETFKYISFVWKFLPKDHDYGVLSGIKLKIEPLYYALYVVEGISSASYIPVILLDHNLTFQYLWLVF